MTALKNSLDLHSSKYEKILILGDFNVEIEEANVKLFCENFYLTCYKNPNKPTCIDLILTKVPLMFQSTCVLETGLPDFQLISDSCEENFQENASQSNNL